MDRFRLLNAWILPLMLLSQTGLLAQSPAYSPFPEKNGRWIINRDGPYSNDSNFARRNLTLYETAGDTSISGFSYRKVNSTAEIKDIYIGDPNYFWQLDFGPRKLAFAYRNDIPAKRVYILTDTGGVINGNLIKEYLWYDFNLETGDTLESTYALKWNQFQVDYKKIIVSMIDSVFICGKYHKRFSFNCGGGSVRLVEGIGFQDNFIKTEVDCPFEPLFFYATYFSCSPTSISNQEQSPLSIVVYPNPAHETIQLNYSGLTQEVKGNYQITDCMGRKVLKGTYTNEPIRITDLSNGMYMLHIVERDGNFHQLKFVKQ